MTNKLTADILLGLLAERHSGDVFFNECKNGPTWFTPQLRKLDGWALLTTWSPWTTIGYEIKVARSDFDNDNKWHEYLPYCHHFYFVCPAGLIKPTDLPVDVGIIWSNLNGTGLRVKRLSARHEPDTDKLCMLMSYALMNKVKKVWKEPVKRSPGYIEEYRAELERADERKALAYFVGEHIRSHVRDADNKLNEAKRLMGQIWEFERLLEQRGIKWKPSVNAYGAYNAFNQVKLMAGCVEDGLTTEMRQLARRLAEAADRVEGKP